MMIMMTETSSQLLSSPNSRGAPQHLQRIHQLEQMAKMSFCGQISKNSKISRLSGHKPSEVLF